MKEQIALWSKSSYSGTQSSCVELAHTNGMIRDSKNEQVLRLNQRAVTGLVRAVKTASV